MKKIGTLSRKTAIVASLSAVISIGVLQGACSRYAVPVKAQPEAPPPPDTARVYFINPGASNVDTSVFILKETKLIGYLEGKKVSFVDLPAGEHFFMTAVSNPEGIYAKLAGGRTYYLRLTFAPGPETVLGNKTVIASLEPIVPGDEAWEERHQWVEHAQLVALNKERARGWNSRWSERNQRWFMQFKRGEKPYTSLNPDQGE